MKRVLMATTILISTAAAGYAQDATQLREAVENYFTTSVFDVDMSTLTPSQVTELYGIINSSSSDSQRLAGIRGVLESGNVVTTQEASDMPDAAGEPANSQIYDSVVASLRGTEFDGRADELSEEELVTAYALLNNASTPSEKRSAMYSLFN